MPDEQTTYIANSEGERTHVILPVADYQMLLDKMDEFKSDCEQRRRELIRLERRMERLEISSSQM